ncbi:MAG: BRO family protein [Oscillospiraceae bacterium]|nr:BRO family protein [Oscillospiraceae bacterium]
MNEIQVFENPEFGSIRTIEIEGQPYWVAVDVTNILGYTKSYQAVRQHCHYPLKQGVTDKLNRARNTYVIPESDLYRLIINSKLPKAKEFEKWVFETVLPQIRKTGSYAPTKAAVQGAEENPDIKALSEQIREIKEMLTQPRPQVPMIPSIAETSKLTPIKTYINAALYLLEKNYSMSKSSILHCCYVYLDENGFNTDDLKAEYQIKHDIANCSMLDAVCDNRKALKAMIYCLQYNLFSSI